MSVCFPSCMNISPGGGQTGSAREPMLLRAALSRGARTAGRLCPEPPASGLLTLRQLPPCPWGSLPSTTEPQVPSEVTNLAASPLLASFSSLSLFPTHPLVLLGSPRNQEQPPKNYLSRNFCLKVCLWGPPNQENNIHSPAI